MELLGRVNAVVIGSKPSHQWDCVGFNYTVYLLCGLQGPSVKQNSSVPVGTAENAMCYCP